VGDGPCGEGHDEELQAYADGDGAGLAEDFREIGEAQGEAHAEHDDAEAGFDVGLEPGPSGRLEPGPQAAEDDPEGEGVGGEEQGAMHVGKG
jgi:hypothetical protein